MLRCIELAPKDQDVQVLVHHYLWRDLMTEEALKVYRMPRQTFAIVNAHVNKYTETFPDATREILHDMYLDDYLTGAHTDKSALKLQQEMSDILIVAAFNMQNGCSLAIQNL